MSSVYSTSVKTRYIDPHVDQSNSRMVFKLDSDRMYYSNLRIASLGCQIATNDTAIVSPAGLYGLIEHAYLYNGSELLDSVRFANRYLAFKNINVTNDEAYSVVAKLSKGAVGFRLESDGVVDSVQNQNVYDREVKNSANDSDTQRAYLDLKVLFPMLSSISHLDTSLFKALRVELQFSTRLTNMMALRNNGALTTQPAILCADEILDDKLSAQLKASLKGVNYVSIEHDVVNIPAPSASQIPTAGAGNAPLEQQVNSRIKGYDNKTLGRIVAMKAYSTESKYEGAGNTTLGQGRFGSVAMKNESVNYKLNGANVFPANGLDRPSKRADVLHQAWGDVNILPFANETACGRNREGSAPNFIGLPEKKAVGRDNERIGQSDYHGFQLDQRVGQLVLNYKREIPADGATNPLLSERQALNYHIYAEVYKELKIDGNGYTIKYV